VTVLNFLEHDTTRDARRAYPVQVLHEVFQHRAQTKIARTRFAAEMGRAGERLIESPRHGVLVVGRVLGKSVP
jgi:hypothetical protein